VSQAVAHVNAVNAGGMSLEWTLFIKIVRRSTNIWRKIRQYNRIVGAQQERTLRKTHNWTTNKCCWTMCTHHRHCTTN